MDRTRSWVDPRDGALWSLQREFGGEPNAVLLLFTRGAERRTVFADRQADLHSFTDQELEALLDQAHAPATTVGPHG